MITRHCILLIILFVGYSQLSAQHKGFNKCGTVQHNENLRSQNPNLNSSEEFEKWMAQRVKRKSTEKERNTGNAKYGVETFKIPIIFHIIHDGEQVGATANIASQYIDAQIEQLNLDFANLSGSTYGVAVDTEIQFCAAKIDPSGNCLAEPGINRIHRNTLGLSPPPYTDTYFNTSIKPTSQWDPNNYLNVWTGDLSSILGSILGSAQFPEATYLQGIHDNNGAAQTDGCLLNYTTVGSLAVPFPSGTATNKGRTLTHEMGHFLGLHHIWGDGAGNGACSKDDFCADTPQQGSSSSGCPTGNDSCPSSPGLDMVENYMDYSNDDCFNTFTADQRDRMHVVMDPLFGSVRRASLNNSPACGCAPIAAFSPTSDLSVCSSTNSIQFLNESIRTYSGSTYSWVFSGVGASPTTSNLENPSITVSSSGNLTVTLNVTTANGTNSTGPVTVVVNTVTTAPPSPSLISPNNADTQVALSPTFTWSASPTADEYYVEVSTDPTMAAPVTYQEVSSTSVTIYGLNPLTTYYWRVIPINDCNAADVYSGNSSSIRSYTTIDVICTNYSATDTPKIISTSGKPTITSTISLPSGLGAIASFKISKLTLEHSYMEDLTISLTNPNGITALLVDEICGSSNDLNLIFDDSGSPNSSIPCPATDGNAYQAQSPFTIFNGTDPAGDWILTISDAVSFDGGQLICWDIEICTENVLLCPGSLATSTSANNVSCHGQNTGLVTAVPSGGTAPYSFVWQNSIGQAVGTTASVVDLPADNYTVFITDANACIIQGNTEISEPASPLTNTMTQQNISCFAGADGMISTATSGGTGTYSYVWSTGANTPSITNLNAGSYSLTITDSNNCNITQSISLTQPTTPLNITETVNQIDCAGTNTGSISLMVSGGTPGYTFSWSNGGNSIAINDLSAATYSVTITDANSCISTRSYTISEPSQQLALFLQSKTDVSCQGLTDGELDIQITGGTLPYFLNWSSGEDTPVLQNLPAGTYTLTVTDNNQCSIVSSYTVTEPPFLSGTLFGISDVTCFGEANGMASITPSGGTGPHSISWSSGETGTTASSLPAGQNSVTITDNNNCTFVESLTTNSPFPLSLTIDQANNPTCPNGADGLITVSTNGGVGPVDFNWSNGQTSQSILNLSDGTYQVTVTDANGCEIVEMVTLIDPLVDITVSTNAPSCPGNADGSASVIITGGLAPYTYLWSTGATSPVLSNRVAGTYSLSIQDDNGCSFTEIVTIPAASLTVTNTAYDLTCQNTSNGALAAQASGGQAPYTYEWKDNLGNVVSPLGLPSGTYTLKVTDNNGCIITSNATIQSASTEYSTANNNRLNGIQSIPFDYEADGKIESIQLIDATGQLVDYDSGESITLEAGFEVKVGSIFQAFIDGCGGVK